WSSRARRATFGSGATPGIVKVRAKVATCSGQARRGPRALGPRTETNAYPSHLAVAQYGLRRFVTAHEQRKDVELGSNRKVGARLEELGLLQLHAQTFLRQDVRRGDDVIDTSGKEHEAGPELSDERYLDGHVLRIRGSSLDGDLAEPGRAI